MTVRQVEVLPSLSLALHFRSVTCLKHLYQYIKNWMLETLQYQCNIAEILNVEQWNNSSKIYC